MAADITLSLEVTPSKSGVKKIQKDIVGSWKEVGKELKNQQKQLELTDKDIAQIVSSVRRASQRFGELGGKVRVFTNQKAEIKKLTTTIDSLGRAQKFVVDQNGKKRRISKQVYNAIKKENAATRNQVRLERQTVRSKEAVARKMRDILVTSKQRVMNRYVQQITQLRVQMKGAGYTTKQVNEKLVELHASLNRVRKLDMSKFANMMQKAGRGVNSAQQAAAKLESRQKGKLRGMTPHVGAPPSSLRETMVQNITGGLHQALAQASGAIGFTFIDLGTRLQQAMSDTRFKGQLSQAGGELASAFGGMFSGALGAITGDIGKFAGTVGELLVNLMTQRLRMAGQVIAGLLKGLGYTIASGMVGAFAGGMAGLPTGPGAFVTAGIGAVSFAMIAAITTSIQSLTGIAQTTVAGLIDTFSKGLTSLTSLFSATFKSIGLVVGGAVKGISTIVKNMWNGIVKVTKVSLKQMTERLATFVADSSELFLKFETLATKSAKEVVDVYGKNVSQMQSLIGQFTMRTGQSMKDVGQALFTTVSSGFRDVADAAMILRDASRLALLDMTSLKNATNALTLVLRNYADTGLTTADITAQLAAATTLGVTDLNELGPALKFVAGTANRYNIQLKEMLASMSALTRIFGRGSSSQVARYLSRMFETLFAPRPQTQKALEKMGIDILSIANNAQTAGIAWVNLLEQLSTKDIGVQDFRKIFGRIQARRAAMLIDPKQVQALKKIVVGFDSVISGQKTQLELVEDSTEIIAKRLTQAWENVKRRIGEITVGVFKAVFGNKRLLGLVKKINKFLFHPKTTRRIQRLVNSLEKQLQPAVEFVGGSVHSLAGAFVRMIKDVDFGVITNNLRNALNSMKTAVQSFAKVVNDAFTLDGGFGFGDVFGVAMKTADKFFKSISEHIEAFKKGGISGLFGKLKSGSLIKSVEKALPTIKSVIFNVFDAIVKKLGSTILSLASAFADIDFTKPLPILFRAIGQSIKQVLGDVFVALRLSFWKLWKDVGLPIIEKLAISSNKILKEVLRGASTLYDVGFGILKMISNAAMIIKAVMSLGGKFSSMIIKTAKKVAALIYPLLKLKPMKTATDKETLKLLKEIIALDANNAFENLRLSDLVPNKGLEGLLGKDAIAKMEKVGQLLKDASTGNNRAVKLWIANNKLLASKRVKDLQELAEERRGLNKADLKSAKADLNRTLKDILAAIRGKFEQRVQEVKVERLVEHAKPMWRRIKELGLQRIQQAQQKMGGYRRVKDIKEGGEVVGKRGVSYYSKQALSKASSGARGSLRKNLFGLRDQILKAKKEGDATEVKRLLGIMARILRHLENAQVKSPTTYKGTEGEQRELLEAMFELLGLNKKANRDRRRIRENTGRTADATGNRAIGTVRSVP